MAKRETGAIPQVFYPKTCPHCGGAGVLGLAPGPLPEYVFEARQDSGMGGVVYHVNGYTANEAAFNEAVRQING